MLRVSRRHGHQRHELEGFSAFAWAKALVDAGYPHYKLASSDIVLDKAAADALAALPADEENSADIAKVVNPPRIAAGGKKLADIFALDNVVPAADGAGGATATVTEAVPVMPTSAR